MERKEAQDRVDRWHLGQTSQRYESSGLGAGTISSGKDDHGGVSYGTYQLSSREGTVQEYLAQSRYCAEFKGLEPATPAFDAKWRELAQRDASFGADQHDFIGRSHYGQQLQRLHDRGLDMSQRGRAVQDCVWSTSVRFRGLAPTIFAKGIHERFGNDADVRALTDTQIVDAVQGYKVAHNATLFSHSPKWQASLLRRAEHERADLLALADAERIAATPLSVRPHGVPASAPDGHPVHPPGPHGSTTKHAHEELAYLGYTGVDGKLIHADGRAGRNTRHAVEQYQRDHGLAVTGVLDGATRSRLDRDERTMASSTHPAHGLYSESLTAVAELDRRLNVSPRPVLAGPGGRRGRRRRAGRDDARRQDRAVPRRAARAGRPVPRRCGRVGDESHLGAARTAAGDEPAARSQQRSCASGDGRSHARNSMQRVSTHRCGRRCFRCPTTSAMSLPSLIDEPKSLTHEAARLATEALDLRP